jgi:ufm1-conjugating enzyme 1
MADASIPADDASAPLLGVVEGLPALSVRASPREKEEWVGRLREELHALVAFVRRNKVYPVPPLARSRGFSCLLTLVSRLRVFLPHLFDFLILMRCKATDSDWVALKPSDELGTAWTGTVSHVYQHRTYTFALQFEIPALYPLVAPDLALPELEGLTPKMFRGGNICLTQHFQPLWSRNSPRFGIAHALALGMAPWLAAEIPFLADAYVFVSMLFSSRSWVSSPFV